MDRIPDPFPTTTLTVPNLSELVARLRDPALSRCVWVLANAAARLSRGSVKVYGPEHGTAAEAIERGLRTDDAMAFRKAAALGPWDGFDVLMLGVDLPVRRDQ